MIKLDHVLESGASHNSLFLGPANYASTAAAHSLHRQPRWVWETTPSRSATICPRDGDSLGQEALHVATRPGH